MPNKQILLGVVGKPHGVRGLAHVHSYTADPDDLARYAPLHDGRGRSFSLRWRSAGVAEISELVEGRSVPVADRDAAERLVNTRLHIDRARLPRAGRDEFYVADLVGLEAFGFDGTAFGVVTALHDYGAGTSLEIGPHLVPFTRACVPTVDIAAGRIMVVLPSEVVVPEQMVAE